MIDATTKPIKDPPQHAMTSPRNYMDTHIVPQ
jgi:hypothetical protein